MIHFIALLCFVVNAFLISKVSDSNSWTGNLCCIESMFLLYSAVSCDEIFWVYLLEHSFCVEFLLLSQRIMTLNKYVLKGIKRRPAEPDDELYNYFYFILFHWFVDFFKNSLYFFIFIFHYLCLILCSDFIVKGAEQKDMDLRTIMHFDSATRVVVLCLFVNYQNY